MRLSREELKGLMKNKLIQAGLREDHADQTAEILTWAHERGFASHGAVRVEYYCERIFKGGITHEPTSHGIRRALAQESWMETMVSVTG